jgi:hypothetical protein
MSIDLDLQWRSWQIAQTSLPDLTQPQSLNLVASQLPIALAIFVILAIGLGAAMALINFSTRNTATYGNVALGDLTMTSTQLLRGLQQTVVVAIVVLIGFLLCSTLANRQNSWEQGRLAQKTPALAATAEVIQQTSPQVSYTSQEPYVYTTQLGGKLVKVQDKRDVTRQTSVSGSNLQVAINPSPTKTGEANNYAIDFKGDYQITNPVGTTDRFTFKIAPPTGYSLLQNFTVERDGKRLTATTPGEYSFPLQIASGSISKLRVSYVAQGSPQWVYSAQPGSLANFRMSIASKVPRIDFVSGVVPTKVSANGDNKVFTWAFDRNASVQRPFGVSVDAPVAAPTGKLPLLLILAPGIFLWWVALLCLSIPMRLPNIAIAGFVFFAGMFALTYFSRLADPLYIWGGISLALLGLVWGLGRGNWRISLAAIISTIVGAIVPVFGFLLPDRGVILSVAGLMSILWLVARNWYGWYQLEPRERVGVDRSLSERPDEAYLRHDLLEESAKHNRLNPATPNAEESE